MTSPAYTRWMPVVISVLVLSVLGMALSLLLPAQPTAHARRRGIVGYSGNPATNDGEDCSACHAGGFAPEVSLDGPSVVPPGAMRTFTLTVAEGQLLAAGFDVSTTAGFLQSLGADTRVQEGEVTHANPKIVDPDTGAVTFAFGWTAPMVEGTEVTLYGAGNSVDGDTRTDGDAASTVVKQVLVSRGPAPTPVPTATPSATATVMPSATAPPDPATATAAPSTPTVVATETVVPEPTEPVAWEALLPSLVRGAPLR